MYRINYGQSTQDEGVTRIMTRTALDIVFEEGAKYDLKYRARKRGDE